MRVFISSRLAAFVHGELPKLLDLLDRITQAINSNPYSEHEDVVLTTASIANEEFQVKLSRLNKLPKTYEVLKKDKPCDVYGSGKAWGRNILYLKCTGVSARITLRIT